MPVVVDGPGNREPVFVQSFHESKLLGRRKSGEIHPRGKLSLSMVVSLRLYRSERNTTQSTKETKRARERKPGREREADKHFLAALMPWVRNGWQLLPVNKPVNLENSLIAFLIRNNVDIFRGSERKREEEISMNDNEKKEIQRTQ
jgi:hypothetical protein